jgi:hypothetical protein
MNNVKFFDLCKYEVKIPHYDFNLHFSLSLFFFLNLGKTGLKN